jgi:hypothetical protein
MEEILRKYSKILHLRGSAEKIDQSIFYHYFIMPFTAGIAGFACFLFLLMILETAAFFVGINKSISIGMTEVLIAALGFILQFTYQVFNNYNSK